MRTPESETAIVTPAMADSWLNHNLYERQRRRAEWHVNRLAIEIEKGRFIAGTQIHFGVLEGKLKLVNGQHTLAAIVEAGIATELTVLKTPVEDEAELGQLYSRHDRHRSRTPHDAFLGMGLSGELDLAELEVNSFGSGLKWVLGGFRRPSVHNDVEIASSLDHLAHEMREWGEVARKYFECVREAKHGMKAAFRRAPVVAVGLVTMKHQEEKARRFWGGAAEQDGLTRHDPRAALNDFLRSNTSGHGDPIRYIRHVAGAWNKHYENGELQFLRPGDTGKIGVTIRGTPYKAWKRKGSVVVPGSTEEDDEPSPGPLQGILGVHA